MQTGTALAVAISTMASGCMPVGTSTPISVKATIAPIITSSPWAKLMSWMMP
jgi:hypothetical protein